MRRSAAPTHANTAAPHEDISRAPCALLATHLVCVLVLTNSREATAIGEEKEVPAEVLRAVFAHGAAGARDARVVSS